MSDIVVYSRKDCPNCKMLKEALIEKGIMFEERDLDNTNVYAELVMRDIHILSAPAIEIKGIMFIYYK